MGTTEQALLVAGLINVAFGMGVVVTAGVAAVKIVANNHLEFNAIWGARLALVIMAAFWALSSVINSEVLWSPSNGYVFRLSEDIVPHVCRGYMVLKYGVAEPAFLLIIIHIVKFTPGDVGNHWLMNHKNMQICWNAFFWWLPFVVVQAGLVAVPQLVVLDIPDEYLKLLYKDNTDTRSIGMCQTSVVAIACQGVFSALVLVSYVVYSGSVMEICLNQRLIKVLRFARFWGAIALSLSLLCRVSLVLPFGYLKDHEWIVKIVLHIDSFINTLTALVGLWIFSLRPVLAAAQCRVPRNVLDREKVLPNSPVVTTRQKSTSVHTGMSVASNATLRHTDEQQRQAPQDDPGTSAALSLQLARLTDRSYDEQPRSSIAGQETGVKLSSLNDVEEQGVHISDYGTAELKVQATGPLHMPLHEGEEGQPPPEKKKKKKEKKDKGEKGEKKEKKEKKEDKGEKGEKKEKKVKKERDKKERAKREKNNKDSENALDSEGQEGGQGEDATGATIANHGTVGRS